VQFRAGSSFIGSGGTVHPAAEIISHPLNNYSTFDFDVAVVRVSDNICPKLTLMWLSLE